MEYEIMDETKRHEDGGEMKKIMLMDHIIVIF
jgi:hypothetical protein